MFADVIFMCNAQFRSEGKSGEKKNSFSNELSKYVINDIRTTIDQIFFTCHQHRRVILLSEISYVDRAKILE